MTTATKSGTSTIPRHVERAIRNIDGIIEIAKNEQLRNGDYIFSYINKELRDQGAICGGHAACLVGSLYISHGIKPIVSRGAAYSTFFRLPGVQTVERQKFMRNRPGLKLAYKYINEAAKRYLDRHFPEHVKDLESLHKEEGFTFPPEEGWGEWLFENVLGTTEYNPDTPKGHAAIRDHMIQVCRNAKRQLKKDYSV
jgi:hypothetical protein